MEIQKIQADTENKKADTELTGANIGIAKYNLDYANATGNVRKSKLGADLDKVLQDIQFSKDENLRKWELQPKAMDKLQSEIDLNAAKQDLTKEQQWLVSQQQENLKVLRQVYSNDNARKEMENAFLKHGVDIHSNSFMGITSELRKVLNTEEIMYDLEQIHRKYYKNDKK